MSHKNFGGAAWWSLIRGCHDVIIGLSLQPLKEGCLHFCICILGGVSATVTNYADPKLVRGFRSDFTHFKLIPWKQTPGTTPLFTTFKGEEITHPIRLGRSYRESTLIPSSCRADFVFVEVCNYVIVDGFTGERTNVTRTTLILFSLRMTINRKYFKTANGSQTGPHWWGHGVKMWWKTGKVAGKVREKHLNHSRCVFCSPKFISSFRMEVLWCFLW